MGYVGLVWVIWGEMDYDLQFSNWSYPELAPSTLQHCTSTSFCQTILTAQPCQAGNFEAFSYLVVWLAFNPTINNLFGLGCDMPYLLLTETNLLIGTYS